MPSTGLDGPCAAWQGAGRYLVPARTLRALERILSLRKGVSGMSDSAAGTVSPSFAKGWRQAERLVSLSRKPGKGHYLDAGIRAANGWLGKDDYAKGFKAYLVANSGG